MAFIHVIIPCYNVEKYLEQAVYSVLNQPCNEIDIVLVDDGSPGRTPQLCHEIATCEKRVHVIHKLNGGVSSARNAGIDYVLQQYADNLSGQYIAFLDGDDAWQEDFLCAAVTEKLAEDFDLIGYQSCVCDENLHKKETPNLNPQEGSLCGGADHVWAHSSQHFAAMFYSCGFLREYHIRFQEGLRYSEDKIFSMTCMYLAERIYLENRQMYLYRIVGGSAMTSRKFGIPYFVPIIDGYLRLDKQMQPYTNPSRGMLMAAKHCVRHYIMDMLDEHFQYGRPKAQVDALLAERSQFVDALTAANAFADCQPDPRYLHYCSSPRNYILKQRIVGILIRTKRLIKRILNNAY